MVPSSPVTQYVPKASTQDSILFRKGMAQALGVRSVGSFSVEGIAAYRSPVGESFFITKEGQRFGPFEHAYSFQEGYARIKNAEGWYLINAACLTGPEEAKRAYGPYVAVTDVVKGRYAAIELHKKVWTFFDKEGKEMKSWGASDAVLSMSGDYTLIRREGKKRVLDAKGVEVVGVSAEQALRICEGFLLVQIPGGRQFISLTGGKDSPVFKFALDMAQGVAPVEEFGGESVYMNTEWKVVEKLGRHRFAQPFFEDVALVHSSKGVMSAIDSDGNQVPW